MLRFASEPETIAERCLRGVKPAPLTGLIGNLRKIFRDFLKKIEKYSENDYWSKTVQFLPACFASYKHRSARTSNSSSVPASAAAIPMLMVTLSG